MALPIPTLDLKIIKDIYRCRIAERELARILFQRYTSSKTWLVGHQFVQRYSIDDMPVLLVHKGPEPKLFKEGGIYLKDNPIPHHINPVAIRLGSRATYWAYEISFL